MAKINALLILAGGQSSRMGVPKALLALPSGQTLLDFHLGNAQELHLPILLADNGKRFLNNQKQNQHISTIKDHLPSDDNGKGQGALSAIVGGLQTLDDEGYLLVVSCDNLLKINKIYDVLTPTTAQVGHLKGDKDYPLLGVYHTSILPTLRQFLASGNRSVMQFLRLVTCQTFVVDEDWQRLANFNLMTEFQQALEYFDD